MPTAPSTEVLIAGAGPTGLVLALWLARRGIRVRIVDKTAEPGTTSRALVVHARTLELYAQLGIAADVVARGLEFAAVNIWVRGRRAARAELEDIGRGLSPFPFIVILPQDEHEKLLVEHLERAGVVVERRTRLLGFEERADHVVARLGNGDGTETTCAAQYLAGCDGAHSTVREALGVGFEGGTYDRLFYVADVELSGPVDDHELHIALDRADFVAVFPMKGAHRGRLIGTVRAESVGHGDLAWNDVSASALEGMQIGVDVVNWFSTYHVHHRVAGHFRRGRVFLAGDAAHVHSPVGGQGMNTGIGDAINLAWKLADVLRARAGPGLLDTYEPERSAFARRLVATTDRAFTFVTRDGPIARCVRLHLVPPLVSLLAPLRSVRRLQFLVVSQIRLRYRHVAFNAGRAGSVHGGDRLPWTPLGGAGARDNFAPLVARDWQVHVYGTARDDLARACADLALPLHVFAWQPSMRSAGLARDAAYLVRPDGYVAWAGARARGSDLEEYSSTRDLHRATQLERTGTGLVRNQPAGPG